MRAHAIAGLSLLALAGCAAVPSQATIDRHNQRASDAAIARAQARFGGARFEPASVTVWNDRYGAPPEPDPTAPIVFAATVRGQGQGDQLYRMADGTLGLAGPTCASGDSCGCDLGIGYIYLRRADGHVAVVRLAPKLTTYVREVDACGYGCGQPSPEPPTVIAGLGVTDPAMIEIVEEPVRVERVVERCANPTPRP